jgi:WD40 repeat protein
MTSSTTPHLSGASLGLARTPRDPGVHEPEPPEELQALALDQRERYREGGLLGRGGMGEIRTVYDARLGRAVALKTPVARDDETTRRFVVEATLTARLVHPGIVAVHDAGLGEGGRPYYTMPIVQGRSLALAIAESSAAERLRLVRHFLDACEAIAYAHSQALLHRDLKPANILVGRFGETIVVDWGLAGPIGEAASAGTPAYMPPEQAAGEPLDARADVYALGVTLREILSGSPLVDPPRGTPPELLAIIERACADDPNQRYADGRALAEDVAAWFEGRRVAAHRYSAAELLGRMWAAYRVPITIVLLALVALAVAIGVGYRRTAIEREHAQASEREAIAARARAEDNLAQAEVAQSLVAAAASAWPQAELYAAGALQHGPSAAARGVLARFDTQSRARLLRRSPLPSCRRLVPSVDGTQVACSSKQGVLHFDVERPDAARELGLDGNPLALFEGERMIVVDGTRVLYVDAAHPRGHELAHATAGPSSESIGRDGRIGWVRGIGEHWLDVDSPDLRLLSDAWCIRLANAAPAAVGLRDNGSRIVFCQDGSVLTEDVPGGPQRELMRLDPALGAPVFVTLSPGSRLAAISLASSELIVVDLVEARVLRSFGRLVGTPFALALSESRLALADGRNSVFVWEVASGALVVRLASAGRALRWLDASGTRLRSFGDTLEDWQLPDTLARPHVIPLGSGIAAISHDPRRARVLSAHGDGQLRLTQLDGTVPPLAIPLDASVAKDVEFSPDGARAIAVCAQRDVLFELELDTPDGPRVHELPSLAGPRVVWLADRRRIVGQYRQGLLVSLGELGRPVPLTDTPVGAVRDLDSSPDRSFALALLGDQLIRIDTEVHALRELDGQNIVLAAHREGYVAARGRLVERLDGAGTTTLRIELPEAVLVTEVAISPDGRYLALGRFDGAIELRSFATLDLLALLQGHTSRVAALAFDGGGTWLISGGWDGELRQWSMHALERSPAQVRREAEAAWGLTLEQLLADEAT